MIYEWEPTKANVNLRDHSVSFEEAATVFLDPLAVTYPDPDHSDEEDREITIGHSVKQRILFVSHYQPGDRIRIISARKAPKRSARSMKKAKSMNDDLRPEYDLFQLRGGVSGKYYRQATAGTNLVLIEPELATVFPNTESVNRALRLLVDTAEAAASPSSRRRRAPNKRLKRTA